MQNSIEQLHLRFSLCILFLKKRAKCAAKYLRLFEPDRTDRLIETMKFQKSNKSDIGRYIIYLGCNEYVL